MNVMEASEPINLFTCLSIDPPYQAMDEPQNALKTFSWVLFRDRINFPKDYSNICYSCCTICLRTKEHHNLKFSSNHHIPRGCCSCVIVFVLVKYMWVGTWRKKKENNQHGFFAYNVGTSLILVFGNFFFTFRHLQFGLYDTTAKWGRLCGNDLNNNNDNWMIMEVSSLINR